VVKSDAKSVNAGTLAGMNRMQCYRLGVTAAVLSVLLGGTGFAQNGAPAELSPAEQAGAQQGFRITPVRPIAELRAEALKATPPDEHGTFERSELVEFTDRGGWRKLDIRYASANNFLGEPVYEQARAFLQLPAFSALVRVNRKVREEGHGLLVYDAYRPWYVTKIFWEATPENKREFVADPAQGSSHNRGCAVDLTLYDLKTGAAVAMPSEYDEMTPRAYADYAGGAQEEREHRRILREAMESEGFVQRPNEWWHYDYKDCQKYQILNLPFDRVPDPIYAIGKGVSAPKILNREEPSFTDDARIEKVQGNVMLDLVVGADGNPRDISLVRGLGHGLDEESIRAVKQWTFEPAKKDGNPVAVAISIEVGFKLYPSHEPVKHLSVKDPSVPKILKRTDAEFSDEARVRKIQGSVILDLVVGVDGIPRDISVVKGLGHGLDEEAIKAVKQWTFEPARKDGKPVPVKIRVEVAFKLY